jgi:RNA polymerase sigma-70 factor (ECF subfamily)
LADSLSDIIKRSQRGDVAAFRQIVECHQSGAFALAFRMLGNQADAEDVLQDSFLMVWKHLPRFDAEKKFTTWLYRIVVNRCFDRLKARRRKRNIFVETNEDWMQHLPDVGNPEHNWSTKEIAGMIGKLARELGEKQKVVFVLRDLQDLNIDEVVQITGLTIGSVKSNLYYARKAIRQKLQRMNIDLE